MGVLDVTGLGSIADLASNIIDKIWPPGADPNRKMEAQLELQKAVEARELKVIDAHTQVIVTELNQSDNYTKRARPTVVYAGLAFIFMIHVIFPMVTYWSKATVPALALPSEFWWAWGSVVSVWAIGRSAEKMGAGNKALDLIMGKK